MKAKILSIICVTIFLAGCTKNVNESVYDDITEISQDVDTVNSNDTIEENADISSDSEFPPNPEIAVSVTTLPSLHYETGEEIPAGRRVEYFELDGAPYLESEFGFFVFFIEDDGNIVIDGAEFEDNEVVQALRELYTLEYIGTTLEYGHLFRYGDDILAIMESPWAKTQLPYFKDTDYDESQFYTACIFEPYVPNDYALTLPVD